MDNGTLQQQQHQPPENPPIDRSPPPEDRTDSPESEQPPANKDSDSAQPPTEQSPPAEQPAEEGDANGEAAEKSPAEMTVDLRSFRKPGEKTFTQRSRLFVGNIPQNMTEEEFKNMFAKYGDVNEVFVNGERGFGLIRLVSKHVFCFVNLIEFGSSRRSGLYVPFIARAESWLDVNTA